MAEVRVPKLNSNDDSYTLLAWLVPDGEQVAAGTPVAEVETSKAVEELVAPAAGHVCHRGAAGSDIVPGQVIATVTDGGATPAAAPVPPVPAAESQLITAPARARMAALGVAEAQVAALTTRLVRAADIDALASAPGAPPGPVEAAAGGSAALPISKAQRAVGRAVTRSHASIPAAYTVVKVDVGAVLARAKEITRQVRRPVGLAELAVAAVATLTGAFPLFFSALTEDGGTARWSGTADVGVTVDTGSGLYVPVLRDAATLPIGEIATRLMGFRVAATDASFRASDLDGANITVTLHTEADVMMAVPFVFPGQVCALAVAAPALEVVLDPDGVPGTRTVVHIGLAYDHRVVNGRDAAMFLSALRSALVAAAG